MTSIRFLAALAIFACSVCAQPERQEPAAVLELGPAVSRNLKDSASSAGPSIAVEITPIEHWLELEAGTTRQFSRHSAEWDTDLLFKKPWTLSQKVEFMFGVGPEWVHARQDNVVSNSIAGEVVLDFMFWPAASRRFGWFVEPGFEYNFGPGRERSFGISAGLLIAIPKTRKRRDGGANARAAR